MFKFLILPENSKLTAIDTVNVIIALKAILPKVKEGI